MKLAVIGKVIETAGIPGADRIKRATVVCGDAGKWSGVVGLDIEVGELVTVFLQDALLPPDARWQFMERHKWRVRMARFKGVPSECVILKGAPDMPVGTDLMMALGVTKFHKPLPVGMSGEMSGAFPGWIPKTDEPNFQTVPEMVERMGSDPWYAAEKADGTSCTVWNDEQGMHVCSRNWELREFTASGAGNAYWHVARRYAMERMPTDYALQFEIVGPGIQGNPMGLKELEARAFTLHDIMHRNRCDRIALEGVCADRGVPVARVLGSHQPIKGVNGTPEFTNKDLQGMADTRYPNGAPSEGIVVRAVDSSWSFKVLNLAYRS